LSLALPELWCEPVRPDERLIIFAHPRSGSTNLLRVLQLHPELDLLEEPFNEEHAVWRRFHREHRQRITDMDSFASVLREIYAEYDGFKTLAYQLPEELNRSMLLAPERKIVFHRRRNLLQAVVSGLISAQTGLWNPAAAQAPLLDYYAELRPLSLEKAAGRLNYERSMIDFYADLLSHLPASRCLNLFYEDFFLAPPAERELQLTRLFEFLEVEPVSITAADRYINPARARLNSEETYARVPNLREIDEALGSDAHGRLFDVS